MVPLVLMRLHYVPADRRAPIEAPHHLASIMPCHIGSHSINNNNYSDTRSRHENYFSAWR